MPQAGGPPAVDIEGRSRPVRGRMARWRQVTLRGGNENGRAGVYSSRDIQPASATPFKNPAELVDRVGDTVPC